MYRKCIFGAFIINLKPLPPASVAKQQRHGLFVWKQNLTNVIELSRVSGTRAPRACPPTPSSSRVTRSCLYLSPSWPCSLAPRRPQGVWCQLLFRLLLVIIKGGHENSFPYLYMLTSTLPPTSLYLTRVTLLLLNVPTSFVHLIFLYSVGGLFTWLCSIV